MAEFHEESMKTEINKQTKTPFQERHRISSASLSALISKHILMEEKKTMNCNKKHLD